MTLSKERLKEIAVAPGLEPCDYEETYSSITTGEIQAMARELLERRERDKQEPVGYTYNRGINCEIVAADLNTDCPCGIDLYAAPPAPVVPDPIEPDYDVIKGILPTSNPDEYACCIAADMWNACRAAMLQSFGNSEQLNSPAVPVCWCHACRPVTMTDMRLVVCPECGNKRCPKANDHRNACSGSNEPGQDGSAYPIAPKQESE
ncbi:hypothetical protein [Pseudescherichia vulneris]|uniref:hypothetical protein n=1 Tax=Pseudescherichia vulneris TaxID=566 RepID=UPI0028D18D78|nr:hypothetical protein [Pseudescherichia vulneris]